MVARRFDDPEAVSFADGVRDWLAKVRPAEWDDRLHGHLSPEEHLEQRRRWDALVAQGGYAGIDWPKTFGGLGLGIIEDFLFFEAAAAASAPDTLNYIGYNLAGPALIACGTKEQQERYLPGIIRAEELWCEGFSEPDAGSDMAAVSTTATRTEGGWVINGQKIWTSLASQADLCYLLVRTDTDLPRRHNLSVFIVTMDQPGVEVRPIRQITDEYEFSEVFFSDAFVAQHDLLGALNEGWSLGTLAGFRQGRGVKNGLRRYVLIRSAMDTLLTCARETAAPQPWRLDREVQLLKWHVMRATETIAAGGDARGPGAGMRLVWAELWQRIAYEGMALGCPVHEPFWRHEYLHCRSVTIAGGTSEIQRNVIANTVLHLPR